MNNNEVVKQEKKKHGKDIVIIVLVFVIALLLGIIIGQFALNNNSKNSTENNKTNEVTKKDSNTSNTEKNDSNTSNTEKTDNSANTGTSTTKDNTSVTKKTDEEIAKELITQNILELSQKNSDQFGHYIDYRLKEYRIDKIYILTGNDRLNAIDIHKGANGEGDSFPDTDIFAEIIYSIKPVDINNSGWIAGNGAISNGWIEQKHEMVHIVEENGTYKISDMGTSW